MLSKYKKSILIIDEIKKNELKKGLTSKCKNAINEVYKEINVEEDEFELELYKRKSCLLNDIKALSSLKYDMMLSGVGAFFGAVIGYLFQDQGQFFEEIYEEFKGRMLGSAPLEIIYGDSFSWAFGVLFFAIIIALCILYKNKNIKQNDEIYVFQVDMGEYEIKKIDELLEKL